jgi:uncharacterized protein (DUF1810 family)
VTDSNNPYNLQRFVEAQKSEIEQIKEELRAGKKRTHWIWYVFPQVAGLGKSRMSKRYAIESRDEAEAYLAHDILGPRLRECTEIVNKIEGRSAYEIFGSPDDKKFRSSMTLFSAVAYDPVPFETALDKYYDEPDEYTLEFLSE